MDERKLQKQRCANIIRRAHVKIENGEKPYKCNKCPSKYANHGTLYRHKQTHADQPNFKCNVCEKVFQTDLNLYNHKISHLERTIKCESCTLTFKSKSRLRMHENVQCRLCTLVQKSINARHARKLLLRVHP